MSSSNISDPKGYIFDTIDQMQDFNSVAPHLSLGPLDGRYKSVVNHLVNDLSEAALNRYRILVEIEWFIYLNTHNILPGTQKLSQEQIQKLRDVYINFDAEELEKLATIEKTTIHDVKAVEYYVKDQLEKVDLASLKELVHFGCTSEDINNLSYALGIKNATKKTWMPASEQLMETLSELSQSSKSIPMLSHTHGQAATPTTMGKELAVSIHRLQRQLQKIQNAQYLGKFNGATGTYSAHVAAAPHVDWQHVSQNFVESLGLDWNPLTTQIESHDWQSELYADLARFNSIVHNLATDMWTYISMGYFKQIPIEGATGSSTMPHKVNPIRFENAEANIEVSNSLFNTLEQTLTTSRLQRDLSDSAMQRNIGNAYGHSLLAINNVNQGLQKVSVDEQKIADDLDNNWEILAEAIQMAMRLENIKGTNGFSDPYERLKDLTRGQKVTQESMREFIDSLSLPAEVQKRLSLLRPDNYIGLAEDLTDSVVTKS